MPSRVPESVHSRPPGEGQAMRISWAPSLKTISARLPDLPFDELKLPPTERDACSTKHSSGSSWRESSSAWNSVSDLCERLCEALQVPLHAQLPDQAPRLLPPLPAPDPSA